MEAQRDLEIDAYTAVLKAFAAGPPDWEKEEVLTKLRIQLSIDNEFHMQVMTSIREGRVPPRRTAVAARPAASLGGDVVRRAPSSRPSGAGLPRTTSAAPRTGGGGSAQRQRSRPRDMHFAIREDPMGYVGRRVWRYWLTEDPPWVEGYVSQYDPDNGVWTIVYDPNSSKETMEDNYAFTAATPGVDYVMGEYVDVSTMMGSRRQQQQPVVTPEAYNQPPPLTNVAPSKKRKQSMAPVPSDAPFDISYFSSRVPVAPEGELQAMLMVLERRERAMEAELQQLDNMEADSTLLIERATLEKKFAELCEREDGVLRELQRLRATEA